jgi:broad specificity phosphatase PhoE
MTLVYFVTHPDVVIDPLVPVPQWRLSEVGIARMRTFARQPWLSNTRSIYASAERKARDGAAILSAELGRAYTVVEALGENDRSSTGYLARIEFEERVREFFARPYDSVGGWERAIDAQHRITAAVDDILAREVGDHDIAVISHGGVGALFLCHLKKIDITPDANQPGNGGGNYFVFDRRSLRLLVNWRSID